MVLSLTISYEESEIRILVEHICTQFFGKYCQIWNYIKSQMLFLNLLNKLQNPTVYWTHCIYQGFQPFPRMTFHEFSMIFPWFSIYFPWSMRNENDMYTRMYNKSVILCIFQCDLLLRKVVPGFHQLSQQWEKPVYRIISGLLIACVACGKISKVACKNSKQNSMIFPWSMHYEIPWFFQDFWPFFKFHDFSRSGKWFFSVFQISMIFPWRWKPWLKQRRNRAATNEQ